MKNSMAFRASFGGNLLTPDLVKTSNVKNYTTMVSKSDKLRSLDPETMPAIMMTIIYIIRTFNLFVKI